jgi:hypothetical protein
VLEVTADSRRRRFASRADLTNADLVSGRLSTLRGTLRHELAPGHVLALELGGSRNRTQRAFYDYRATDVKGSYTLSFASPLQQANPWSATFSLGSTTRRYGAPDPAVTAATTRNDREWTGGVSLLVPFSSPWALGMAVEHARARSNLTNFNYRNSSVSGSVYYRF